jgi:hypothetical protein
MDALYDVPVKDPDSSLDLLERMALAAVKAVDDYDFAESERFADRRDMDTPPTDVPE